MMGNLNLNENLKSGCSWSEQELPMGTSVLRKSQGQSHSLFQRTFWNLFRIKPVEEKSILCLMLGCCLNTYRGKSVKLSATQTLGQELQPLSEYFFYPFLPERNEVAKQRFCLIQSVCFEDPQYPACVSFSWEAAQGNSLGGTGV